jgi:hypothetical protein
MKAVHETSCKPCPAGSFSLKGLGIDNSCSPCPAGSYSGAGQSQCVSCNYNTFAPNVGSSACQDCNTAAGKYSRPGASECEFMQHDPIIIDTEPPISEKCQPIICCLPDFEFLQECMDCGRGYCDSFRSFDQNPRRLELFDSSKFAPRRSEEFDELIDLFTNSTFVIFPVTPSKNISVWQIVFLNTKTASSSPSDRVDKLTALVKSGILDKSIVRLKIGSMYVIDKIKVMQRSFISFGDHLCMFFLII